MTLYSYYLSARHNADLSSLSRKLLAEGYISLQVMSNVSLHQQPLKRMFLGCRYCVVETKAQCRLGETKEDESCQLSGEFHSLMGEKIMSPSKGSHSGHILQL